LWVDDLFQFLLPLLLDLIVTISIFGFGVEAYSLYEFSKRQHWNNLAIDTKQWIGVFAIHFMQWFKVAKLVKIRHNEIGVFTFLVVFVVKLHFCKLDIEDEDCII
jgi:hypothetical protein